MPTTTHILSDETGQLILAQLQAISQALDAGALSGTQIDTVLADQTPTGAGFLDGGGLKRFFDGLQAQFVTCNQGNGLNRVQCEVSPNDNRNITFVFDDTHSESLYYDRNGIHLYHSIDGVLWSK